MTAPTFAALRAEYAALWRDMALDPARLPALTSVCLRMLASLPAYRSVETLTGVPAAVVAVIHIRESDGDFSSHLHNGDSLNARTVHVPAGRPLNGEPPFSWTTSAVDALRMQHLDEIPWTQWTVERAAYVLELYNGLGYRNKGLRSPYLWGATNQQQPGKYVRDGVFDPTVMDVQLGAMALLKRLWELSPELALPTQAEGGYAPTTPAPVPIPRPRPETPPTGSVKGPAIAGGLIAAAAAALVAFWQQVADWLHSVLPAIF